MNEDLALQLPISQTGADTIARFRYQSAVAAYLALQSCDFALTQAAEIPLIDSVYCEHHEDILLCLTGGKYVAIQVKTRAKRQPLFRSTDIPVVGALKAFIQLSLKSGDQISAYRLITNQGFAATKTSTDLPHILKNCSDISRAKSNSHVTTFVKKLKTKPKKPSTSSKLVATKVLVENEEELTEIDASNIAIDLSTITDEVVLSVLSRVEVQDTWPNLDDLDDKITVAIGTNAQFGNISTAEARTVATSLIQAVMDSSRLKHENQRYLVFTNSNEQKALDCRNQKRWNSQRIISFIAGKSASHSLLYANQPFTNISKDTVRLIQKAQKGLIDEIEIENARDLCASAEALITSWHNRYSEKECSSKLAHLKALVREACLAEHSRFWDAEAAYGTRQLIAIRDRLAALYRSDKTLQSEIRSEHLLGFAWMLTEECTLWWSEKFDL